MRTFYLFLIVVSFNVSIPTNGQSNASLNETLSWLKSKIESYPLCGDILCYTANVTYDLSNKQITIKYTSNWKNQVIFIIPLNKINSYGYEYVKDAFFIVKTKGNNIIRFDISNNGNRTKKNVSIAYLAFDDKMFKEKNLENRLIKAFNHACKLSGGNIETEPF